MMDKNDGTSKARIEAVVRRLLNLTTAPETGVAKPPLTGTNGSGRRYRGRHQRRHQKGTR